MKTAGGCHPHARRSFISSHIAFLLSFSSFLVFCWILRVFNPLTVFDKRIVLHLLFLIHNQPTTFSRFADVSGDCYLLFLTLCFVSVLVSYLFWYTDSLQRTRLLVPRLQKKVENRQLVTISNLACTVSNQANSVNSAFKLAFLSL